MEIVKDAYKTLEMQNVDVQFIDVNAMASVEEVVNVLNIKKSAFSGISKPHFFKISSRRISIIDEMNQQVEEKQTILSSRFLSDPDSYADPEPIILLKGEIELDMLQDPISFPAAPLPYDEVRKTIREYVNQREFDAKQQEQFEKFLYDHEQKVRNQCGECNSIKLQLKQIGVIKNSAITDDEKKEKNEKQKKTRRAQKTIKGSSLFSN